MIKLLLYVVFLFNSCLSYPKRSFEGIDPNGYFYHSIRDTLIKLFETLQTNQTFPTISSECQTILQTIIDNKTNSLSSFYTYKIFFDSSKNKNDIMSYSSCVRNLNYVKANINTTFLVVTITKETNESIIYPRSYTFGLCVPKDCSDKDYYLLLNITNTTSQKIFDLEVNDTSCMYHIDYESYRFNGLYVFNYLPLVIILIQILCTIFTGFPYCLALKISNLAKKCFKNDKNQLINEKRSEYLQRKSFLEIKKAFSLKENTEELFNSKSNSTKINNESGLTYIKGLRGISMIFMILGNVFTILIQSPAHIYSDETLRDLAENWKFSFIFYGIRFAPRILLSCSGYALVFKLMCYFDDKADELEDNKEEEEEEIKIDNNMNLKHYDDIENKEKEEKEINEKELKNEKKKKENEEEGDKDEDKQQKLINKDDDKLGNTIENENSDDYYDDEEEGVSEIRIKFLLQFYLYQIHKYAIVLLVIFFVLFNLYHLQLIFSELSPLWEYMKKYILDKCTALDIILQMIIIKPFLYFAFYPSASVFEQNSDGLFVDYFWLVYNEIIFFLFTGLIIFVCYKYKYSLNHFAIGMGIFLIIIRVVMVILLQYQTSQYFSHLGFGRFFTSCYYNYPYYLIGVYFGLINYTLQKGITLEDANQDHRDYLISPIYNVMFYNKKKKHYFYISGIIIFIFLIASCLSQMIGLKCYTEMKDFVLSNAFNYIYVFDIDILIILLHWVMFGFYIKGDNAISKIVSLNAWGMWNKLYFSFIVTLPPLTLYFLYHSDNRINLTFGNIVFHSIIVCIFTLIVSSILYLTFELPYKRLIKFLKVNKVNISTKNKIMEMNSNISATKDYSVY